MTGFNVPAFCKSVLQLLQADPTQWRYFGPYWWLVKRTMKACGYTRENLALLGGYEDPAAAEYFPPAASLNEALSEAQLTFNHYKQTGAYVDAVPGPGGETFALWDQDAE